MAEYDLHFWGKDELTKFFEHAHTNNLAFFEAHSAEAMLLIDVDAAYRERISSLPLISASEDETDLVLRIFLFMAHSAFLGATRASTSGQLAEAYALVRACLERALYAAYLVSNTDARLAWFHRRDTVEAKKRSKELLRVTAMMRTLSSIDTQTAAEIQFLYDAAIDYGAHPNIDDVRANMATWKEGEEPLFGRKYLHWDSAAGKLCVAQCAAAGIHALVVLEALLCPRFHVAPQGIVEHLRVRAAALAHSSSQDFGREPAC